MVAFLAYNLESFTFLCRLVTKQFTRKQQNYIFYRYKNKESILLLFFKALYNQQSAFYKFTSFNRLKNCVINNIFRFRTFYTLLSFCNTACFIKPYRDQVYKCT